MEAALRPNQNCPWQQARTAFSRQWAAIDKLPGKQQSSHKLQGKVVHFCPRSPGQEAVSGHWSKPKTSRRLWPQSRSPDCWITIKSFRTFWADSIGFIGLSLVVMSRAPQHLAPSVRNSCSYHQLLLECLKSQISQVSLGERVQEQPLQSKKLCGHLGMVGKVCCQKYSSSDLCLLVFF